jgi:hypothetical protein
MPLRYGEVGNCPKANRLGSGSPDETANRLGISPAKRGANKRSAGSDVAGRKIDLIA